MIELLLAIFGVYYLSIAITRYDGPANIFIKARSKAIEPFKSLLICNVCLSPYIALIPALWLADGYINITLYTFGIAGASVAIDYLVDR
jgi:hypothetical protein